MKQYKFGDCIPESIKIYNRLKTQGKNPKLVGGWTEVKDPDGILEPDYNFNKFFYHKK